MIPYGRQSVSQADINAVVEVLQSDFLTQGEMVPRFERAVCDYTGAKYGVAVNSGTSALHIACEALGLGRGDWLWTTPVTFVASANCGLYCGAKVDFVDIDPVTWNISIDCLKKKLIQAKNKGRLPKVLVAVHLCGLSCDMQEIYGLSKEYGFFVIEDACHAIGGRYENQPIGNCQYSDVVVFSFHPVKTITSGEGGMAVTNRMSLAEKMNLFRSHGVTRELEKMCHNSDGEWYYEQVVLGYNYRMTDIHAALGLSQLSRLDSFIAKRHRIAETYNQLLNELPLVTPYQENDSVFFSGLHLYVIRLLLSDVERTHRQVFEYMRKQGIGVNLHYIPIYRHPWYQKMGFQKESFPESEKYYAEALSLPIYPEMKDEDVAKVISVLKQGLKNSCLVK